MALGDVRTGCRDVGIAGRDPLGSVVGDVASSELFEDRAEFSVGAFPVSH